MSGTSTPRAIFLPLCAASTVPPSTQVSRWVFLLFFDLSHTRSSWSNSISVGCLFRGRPEQVFSHCHGRRVLRALSRNWILPHNIVKCLFGGFCVLRRTKRLAPLGYHTLIHFDAIRHVRALSGIITSPKSCERGGVRRVTCKKIINFWCPLNFYVW